MASLLILMIISHLIADFLLQSEEWCLMKEAKGFRSKALYYHGWVVFILTYLFSLSWDFGWYALLLAMLHTLVDGVKSYLSRYEKIKDYLFFCDQILHLVIILGAVWLYTNVTDVVLPFGLSFKWLLYVVGFLFCAKPSNIFIKKIFEFYKIRLYNQESLENAGKLIGVFERLLTLTFVLLGQFEAVGFLIAAKSILRYKEGDVKRTEYVLIGSLLSFGIAIITGIIIKMILNRYSL